MRYIIIFYTAEPKPIEIYNQNEIQQLFERIVELTKNRAKFCIYRVGECVGDFS